MITDSWLCKGDIPILNVGPNQGSRDNESHPSSQSLEADLAPRSNQGPLLGTAQGEPHPNAPLPRVTIPLPCLLPAKVVEFTELSSNGTKFLKNLLKSLLCDYPCELTRYVLCSTSMG